MIRHPWSGEEKNISQHSSKSPKFFPSKHFWVTIVDTSCKGMQLIIIGRDFFTTFPFYT